MKAIMFVVVEDCCAAGSHDLNVKELDIINTIYCHVLSSVAE
jgi:biuret amidohydrolase